MSAFVFIRGSFIRLISVSVYLHGRFQGVETLLDWQFLRFSIDSPFIYRKEEDGMSDFPGLKRWFLGALVGLLFSGLAWANPVNVNEADAERLASVNGIGPVKAERIVDHRDKHGPFKSLDDLVNVKGVGPKLLEKLKPQLRLDGE